VRTSACRSAAVEHDDYTYNYLDQPTSQTDNVATPANAIDDEQITNT